MKIVALIVIVLVVGALAPRFLIRNSPTIDSAKSKCGELGALMLLGNPLERLWIFNISTKHQQQENITVFAYTFFGLKYAEVKVDCFQLDEAGEGRSAQVLRRGLFF